MNRDSGTRPKNSLLPDSNSLREKGGLLFDRRNGNQVPDIFQRSPDWGNSLSLWRPTVRVIKSTDEEFRKSLFPADCWIGALAQR
jgi:hypothetical protein